MRFLTYCAVLLLMGCADPGPNPHTVGSSEPSAPDVTDQRQSANAGGTSTELIRPEDVVYLGAIRLPAGSGGSNWEYSGYAMTYYPHGDPQGADDDYPGSIFAVGHDHHQMVSEIGIPIPRVNSTKAVDELAVATTLQPFHDIRGGRAGELEIPRAGLEFLPSLDPAGPGKLHFCWGQHFQFERDASHGWCELTLDRPNTQGLWKAGNYTNYVTNDYLFEIPRAWSDRHLPGYRLVTGRFRDGLWGGRGPAVLAYKPPDESAPPAPGATVAQVKPLLMYGRPQAGAAELEVKKQWQMTGFSEADEWSGGAWLTAGNRAAVVLVGTKGTGNTWYGFANGVIYPTSGDPNDPVPPVPPFPYDARGWWSKGISAQILFFNPDDLAAVARGNKESWSPQPYAALKIDEYLFDPGYDHPRQKRYLLGACCYDRSRGILYLFERQVEQDEDRSLVHAFRVGGAGG